MKMIEITKCFEDCPHCTGPDLNRGTGIWQFTCQELSVWIENENTIPKWCPLPDAPPNQALILNELNIKEIKCD